jgi:hypothetical protein
MTKVGCIAEQLACGRMKNWGFLARKAILEAPSARRYPKRYTGFRMAEVRLGGKIAARKSR